METYIGQVRMFAGNYAPSNWLICDGSILQISQYDVLFSLLGTTYGGDGSTTFGIPDLRGRMVVGQGTGPSRTPRVLGQMAGSESVSLTAANIPVHSHPVSVSTSPSNTASATNNYLGAPIDTSTPSTKVLNYLPNTFATKTIVPLDSATIGIAGGSTSHENRMPFVCISYIIATNGLYPSPS
jgi:microcystin-dependent protein